MFTLPVPAASPRAGKFLARLALLAGLLIGASAAHATITVSDPVLPGTVSYDGWDNLTAANNPGFPGFPGTGAWPSGGIGSNESGSGDATLVKVSNGTGGGPYPAGGSIYYGGFSAAINNNGGTLAVTDATPLANLTNVVFLIQIGEAWTYDFFNSVLPTLSFNGGSQNLAATDSALVDQLFNGTVTMPTGEEELFINTYLLQWDLSALAGTVTDFAINFTGVQHAQLYALDLYQSDVYASLFDTEPVVPEPATLGMIGLGLSMAGLARRKRRNAAPAAA